MRKRFTVLVGIVVCLAWTAVVPTPAASAEDPMSPDVQEEAASEVMEALASADEPMEMADIEGLDRLGPAPWRSFGRERSPEVLDAWVEVAKQLPSAEMEAAPIVEPALLVTESEPAGTTGLNDTIELGEQIDGFGTAKGEARYATIEGNLTGGTGVAPDLPPAPPARPPRTTAPYPWPTMPRRAPATTSCS